MLKRDEVLWAKIENLYNHFHYGDEESWKRLKAILKDALKSASTMAVGVMDELRTLFHKLWGKSVENAKSVETQSLWSDVQQDLQTMRIIF